ncbi:MAG TPA: short chain dehydrogenase [Acidobacteria bacterium]|nr:short chain dehydrogenase [Acidobacteriota bacterium]
MDAFRDNVVVLTGASRGIGRELALQLADQGAWLALSARDAAALDEVAALCRGCGGQAVAIPADVGEEAQCAALIRKTVEAYGRVDTLINNAGISMWALFEEVTDLSVFETILRINYLGSVWCTWHALPHLKKTRGRLVAVASLTGKTGVPTRSGYAASKHAMVGFFDTLRIELAESGVSVTVTCPDFVATEIRERAFGADGKPLGTSPVQEAKVMTAETCARLILASAARRDRELIPSLRGKIGLWLKLFAPSLIDRIARKAIAEGR